MYGIILRVFGGILCPITTIILIFAYVVFSIYKCLIYSPKKMMYTSKDLGHLGLIAGMCDELSLVSLLDNLVPSDSPDRKVSTGVCVKALILNGLGLVGHRLYLVSSFFADKPIEHLLGENITAAMLNDDRLGRCLDDLYEAGVTELFGVISQSACKTLGLASVPHMVHLDSTSFHVDGQYNSNSYSEHDECIHITQGYSRDHRPDLHQVCLNMIVEHTAGLPLFMEVLSGNSSDKRTFVESIRKFSSSMSVPAPSVCWVADSALYSAQNIQQLSAYGLWLTRVPETLEEVGHLKKLCAIEQMHRFPEQQLSGYRYQVVCNSYGNVAQQWLIIHSEQASKREMGSIAKEYLRGSTAESKELEQLCKEYFSCSDDAHKRLEEYRKQCRYIELYDSEVEAIYGYEGKGKPSKNATKVVKGYRIVASYGCSLASYKKRLEAAGFFILASNDIEEKLSVSEKLMGYKNQHKVEKGFRFLKDPEFHASTLWLKKPERIEAVFLIMALSLLVYSALEMHLRKELQQRNETLPNQSKKEVQNVTMKWVFTLFRGIHCLHIGNEKDLILLNINEIHRKILLFLMPACRKYYKIE